MKDIIKDVFGSTLAKEIDKWRADGVDDIEIEQRIQKLLQGDDRESAAPDQVPQHVSRANGGQLIDVANQNEGGA